MGRIWKYVLVDILLGVVIGQLFNASWDSNYTDSGTYDRSRYPSYEYESERIWNYTEGYEISPYQFTLEDLDDVFLGVYNDRSASIKFSGAKYSRDKDTIFFQFSIPFHDVNHYPDMHRGSGYLVSEEESIVLYRFRDEVALSGIATKIYSDVDEQDYLFFSINDEGEYLNFLNERIKENYEED